ncbi:MAG: hypothetical protein L0Y36_06565 [Planctomycetales bacterium]|nr:hypothetical protein [Planctomycetales bacterium]
MVHIVWLVGALIAGWELTSVLKPGWMKTVIGIVSKGKLVYLAAGIKILVGIIFLVFATQCKLTPIIIVFGVLSIGGAAVFFTVSLPKITAYMNWWKSRPLWMYRLWGVAAVLLGALLVYAGIPK